MNERKIIDRKFLCDLAKEVGMTTLDLEALGENHHWEIVVEGNLLERMIETQRQFERLAVIGDEECRGFYIEVPRPTSEDWGNAEELIASGEYSSMDAYLSDWLAFNPMETRWFVSIRPRACFSPSYNKVKSQTCFVWLLTLL